MIEAAGGLLWRKGPGGARQIALVHRHRYGDWTLPKGKLHPGETPLEGALREVREETGYQPRALSFMGAIAYETKNGVKRVRYWNMIADSDVRQPVDESEISQVVWLEPAEACSRLNYPLEQAIVEAALEVGLDRR